MLTHTFPASVGSRVDGRRPGRDYLRGGPMRLKWVRDALFFTFVFSVLWLLAYLAVGGPQF